MKVEKLCIFYASKYHLSLILLEYLKKEENKKYTVNTYLEEEIEDEINILKEKYKINIYSQNEIDFKKTKDIEKDKKELSNNMIFIIEGKNSYIKEVNEYLRNAFRKNEYDNIKLVYCFNFQSENNIMKNNLIKYDKILYTTGEKVID